LINNNIKPEQNKFTIALSGGADSTALLFIFLELKKEYDFELSACYLNHSIRKESSIEQIKLKELCDNLKIGYYTETIDIPGLSVKNSTSIEIEARNQRYLFFEKSKIFFNSNYIVTGHHQDDQIETFLYRVFTGTGIDGIQSIPFQRDYFIRPLLKLKKQDLINYLNENKITFFTDYTNFSTDISRNYIRNILIPVISKGFPNYDKNIIKFIQNMKDISNVLNENILTDIVFFDKNEWDIFSFNLYSDSMKRVLLYKKIKNLDPENYVSEKQITEILKNLKSTKNNIHLYKNNDFKILKTYNSIVFLKNIPKIDTNIILSFGIFYISYYIIKVERVNCKAVKLDDGFYIDIDKFYGEFSISRFNKDDKICKKNFYKNLYKEFKDKKIPFYLRENIPVLRYNGKAIGYYYNSYYYLDTNYYSTTECVNYIKITIEERNFNEQHERS